MTVYAVQAQVEGLRALGATRGSVSLGRDFSSMFFGSSSSSRSRSSSARNLPGLDPARGAGQEQPDRSDSPSNNPY